MKKIVCLVCVCSVWLSVRDTVKIYGTHFMDGYSTLQTCNIDIDKIICTFPLNKDHM